MSMLFVELWENVRSLRLPQDIQRLKATDGQNPETIAVVEPPTTMVDALEELPTGSLQDVIADLSTHIG